MIPYILIALVSLFISFCCGCVAGYSSGYRAAFAEMLPIVKHLEKLTQDINDAKRGKSNGNSTDASSERGDK